MDEKEMTIEDALEALDQIMEQLEEGEASLEDTFNLYQKGMKLLKECSKKIDKVEKQLQILNENGENGEF